MSRFLRLFLRGVARALFAVKVDGMEHLMAAGQNVVIAPNHVSFLDPGLVRAVLPHDNPIYAIDTARTRQWWVKIVLRFGRAYPVDPIHPFAIRALIAAARAGEMVVVFPEGRLTVTGRPMKIYDGAAFIAEKANVPIVPVRIDGIEPSPFSRVSGAKVRRRWFPRVRITFFPALRPAAALPNNGRARRCALAAGLRAVMQDLPIHTFNIERTVVGAMADAAKDHGTRRETLADRSGQSMGHRALIARAGKFGARLATLGAPGEAISVMLPNDCEAAALILGLMATGRIPAMVDSSRDAQSILSWCRSAGVTTVVTSRAYLQDRKRAGLVKSLAHVVRIVRVEELDTASFDAPARASPDRMDQPGDAALILHGPQSRDDAIVLSHRDLLAQAAQILARVDLSRTDRNFSALPFSHPMGLMVGVLLPLLSGARSMLYAGSTHPGLIADALYNSNATVLFDSAANLAGYARAANALDFRSLRYVFACDGRIEPALQWAFHEKFGLRIQPCPSCQHDAEFLMPNIAPRNVQAA